MSDEIVIRVENLGKKYRLRHQRSERYTALRDVIAEKAKSIFVGRPAGRSPTPGSRPSDGEEFWALREVSFEVGQGEVLGIIGRNGAGKSTLLKILSRITEPTTGRVGIGGRVASLLEVGTGFHPELTGRENIFLNGAIMGMTRAEIRHKFDEIVAFAEVERFLDTPVKRYSSGMYVRLAFAVAAHLEPEILIIDEVLAVGDAAFQQKCLGRMDRAARSEGRTVLFVSHNMAAIQHLCSRALLLRSGQIVKQGLVAEVIAAHLGELAPSSTVFLDQWPDRITNGEARIKKMWIVGNGSDVGATVPVGGTLRLIIGVEILKPQIDPAFGVIVHNLLGEPLLDLRSIHDGLKLGRVSGMLQVELSVERIGLYPGRYLLSPWIADSACTRDIDFPRMCCSLDIVPAASIHGDPKLDPIWGKYHVPSCWRVIDEASP